MLILSGLQGGEGREEGERVELVTKVIGRFT